MTEPAPVMVFSISRENETTDDTVAGSGRQGAAQALECFKTAGQI